MGVIARRAKVDITGSTVTANVDLGRRPDDSGYALRVGLVVHLPAMPAEAARDLVAKADLLCPYSNATRGNVGLTHEIHTG
jgi:organic hydroperoxide reductase OsmC/OhrA